MRTNRPGALVSRNLVPLLADRSGSQAVAFGFIAPLLILVTVGIVDIGRVIWTDTTIHHAAREAARYASMHGVMSSFPASDEEISSVAVTTATGIGLSPGNVAVSWSPDAGPGSTVTIQISYRYDLLVAGFLAVPSIQLDAVARRAVF